MAELTRDELLNRLNAIYWMLAEYQRETDLLPDGPVDRDDVRDMLRTSQRELEGRRVRLDTVPE